MKLIPGKKCFSENGMLSTSSDGFVLPLWDYIEMSLNAQGKSENELIELFDITPTALKSWKNCDRQISKDKLVVLCNMFGVTIDQMIDRDLSDDYQLEDFYGLSKFNDKADSKKFSKNELWLLFDKLNETSFYIKFFALGYIPLESDDEITDDENVYHIDGLELEYYLDSFSMNITYDLLNGDKKSVNSVKYSELVEIANMLKNDWVDKSFEHITAKADKKYEVMLLKSDNPKALDEIIDRFIPNVNELLKIWIALRNECIDYDFEFKMVKVLLAKGAVIKKGDEIDYIAMLDLYKKITMNDVDLLTGKRGN